VEKEKYNKLMSMEEVKPTFQLFLFILMEKVFHIGIKTQPGVIYGTQLAIVHLLNNVNM
jgi:hypothetical protein